MTAIVPQVNIQLKKTPQGNKPGMASKIAVIGAFDTEETNPVIVSTVDEAYSILGDDTSFKGVSAIPHLFYGASSLLAVNITTWTGTGDNKTANKTLTSQNLSDALAKIKGEDFDMLFVAENIDDTAIPIIETFLEESFEMKYPVGFVAGLTRASASAYETTMGLLGDFTYGIITQQFIVGEDELSIVDSGALYCGVLASLNVGNSMTMKTIPTVTGVAPELTFETGSDGLKLLELGYTTVKCQDRTNNTYVVVNSEQANGFDLYINRTRDFVVKEFALHQFLGERNIQATLNEIKQEVDRVKDKCVNTLDLLEDITYSVEKKNASCVDIYINSLLFAGVITKIDVYVTVEVE